MKYVTYTTTWIEDDISGGNLIGEGRWERNILDALIRDGRDVYVVPWNNTGIYEPGSPRIWKSPKMKPANLHDYNELSSIEDTLFLGHSPCSRLDIPVPAKYYVLQFFNGPDGSASSEFKTLLSKSPALVTYNFPRRAAQYEMGFGAENTFCIHGPAVPQVYSGTNNFKAPYLLWISKVLWAWAHDGKMVPILTKIFEWCASALKKDPALKLGFLLGVVGPLKNKTELEEWFWLQKFSAPLVSVKSQVEFFHAVPWNMVDTILKQTRLIVHPWLGFGGPPYETAAHGIPMILCESGHPFQGQNQQPLFPEVISVSSQYDSSFIKKLDQLFTDEQFYIKIGSAYRAFVNNNGSYAAYLSKLDNICKLKGWM